MESQISLQLENSSKLQDYKILEELDNKIDNITQFASKPYFNKTLKRLARKHPENATVICDYIIAEQTEINIKPSTMEGKIKILIWLSNFHSGKSFKWMTKADIVSYLATLRKSIEEDTDTNIPYLKSGTFRSGAHGWFVFLKPLSPRDHTLYYNVGVTGTGPNDHSAEITYDLKVK